MSNSSAERGFFRMRGEASKRRFDIARSDMRLHSLPLISWVLISAVEVFAAGVDVSNLRETRVCGCDAISVKTVVRPATQTLNRPLEKIAEKLYPTRIVTYRKAGTRELKLHIFEPVGHRSSDRKQVFLAIHGGGWSGGNARRFYPIADYFRDRGLVGISLEYRLIGKGRKTTVFDCVADARSAVRFLRQNSARFGIDPNQIIVGGGSAGGHVAAGTAMFSGVDNPGDKLDVSCRPDLLVLYYPVIDTSDKGYGKNKIGQRWKELSPVDRVIPGLPPTLVLHGTADVVTPYEGAVRFHQLMRQAGNDCQLISHTDGRHGYFIFDLVLFEKAMVQTQEFVNSHDRKSRDP